MVLLMKMIIPKTDSDDKGDDHNGNKDDRYMVDGVVFIGGDDGNHGNNGHSGVDKVGTEDGGSDDATTLWGTGGSDDATTLWGLVVVMML
ncbi:hypothetical protein ElyMa_003493800 [Elysia marginata]|uniref:Uncharacterized protein n=1 Tax=Elysia marginata TaxID=1093978 RepID=A0AAV4EE02_9GAST|nr:hypothetical protein ElyMa_003493800 [Elysia marginata]